MSHTIRAWTARLATRLSLASSSTKRLFSSAFAILPATPLPALGTASQSGRVLSSSRAPNVDSVGRQRNHSFLFPPAIPRQLYGKAPRCACNKHRRLDRSPESWRARRRKAAVRSLVCPWSSFPHSPRCPPCSPPRSPRDCSGLLAPRVGGHLPPVAYALLLFLREGRPIPSVLSGSSKGRRHARQNSLAEIPLHHPPDLATVLPSSLLAPASGGVTAASSFGPVLPAVNLAATASLWPLTPSSSPPFSYSRKRPPDFRLRQSGWAAASAARSAA